MATASLLLAAAACGRPGGGDAVSLPEGETDLSCAAVIWAANGVVDDGKVADSDGVIKGKYLAASTGYLTEHAKAKGLDVDAAMGAMKLEAYNMRGMTPTSNRKVPDEKIVERARKCITP